MTTTHLARPPPLSPLCVPAQLRHRVRLRHPGYGDLPNSVLLSLPAVDCTVVSSNSTQGFGFHHRTALTASAIIANNAFDRAYLTHDQAGRNPIIAPLDGVLETGDYCLYVRGEEPPPPAVDVPDSGQRDGSSTAAVELSTTSSISGGHTCSPKQVGRLVS